MKSLFVLYDDLQDTAPLERHCIAGDSAQCGEVILLVVADRAGLASGFENRLEGLQSRAQSLKGMLAKRGVECSVLLEWGSKKDAALSCAQRENARILNAESL